MNRMTIDDVKFPEESWCEHCGGLEPYTAVVDDEGTYYCLDCTMDAELLKLSKEDSKTINMNETKFKIEYHNNRLNSLENYMAKLIEEEV